MPALTPRFDPLCPACCPLRLLLCPAVGAGKCLFGSLSQKLGSWWLAFLFSYSSKLSGLLQTPSQPSHFKPWFGATAMVKGPAYRGSELEFRPLPISLFKELAGYKFSHLKHRSIKLFVVQDAMRLRSDFWLTCKEMFLF